MKAIFNPPPPDLLFVIQFQLEYMYRTVKFDSEMAVARLPYLSTNCTLTFGSSHSRLLIFFSGMKSVGFQMRAIRKETDTPVRVESESNLRYFTVL